MKYEYRFFEWDTVSEDDVNSIGEEGFKLVAVVPPSGRFLAHLILMKEIPDEKVMEKPLFQAKEEQK